MKLKWHRNGDDWVSGDWRIERVFSDAPKGYGWYVAEPIDGGYYDSLAEAKADCQRAHDKASV
jgi:hypothetical protein